jgi:hypothetical protein
MVVSMVSSQLGETRPQLRPLSLHRHVNGEGKRQRFSTPLSCLVYTVFYSTQIKSIKPSTVLMKYCRYRNRERHSDVVFLPETRTGGSLNMPMSRTSEMRGEARISALQLLYYTMRGFETMVESGGGAAPAEGTASLFPPLVQTQCPRPPTKCSANIQYQNQSG